MNLRSLRIFRQIVITGSLAEASAELNISVSAASRLITLLESELKLTLFSRAKRRLVLTDEGDRFYRQTEHILRGLDELSAVSSDIKRQTNNRLSLVTAAPLVMGLISPTLAQMHRAGMDFDSIINVETRFDLESKVAARAYNLGIISLPIENAIIELTVEPFLEARVGVLIPKTDPLASKAEIALEDLLDRPFVALCKGQRWRDRMDALFTSIGTVPTIHIETTSTVVVQQLVREGLGLTIVDRVCGREDDGPVILRPLAEEKWITYATIHPKGHRPALAERFVESMCQFIEADRARSPSVAEMMRLI